MHRPRQVAGRQVEAGQVGVGGGPRGEPFTAAVTDRGQQRHPGGVAGAGAREDAGEIVAAAGMVRIPRQRLVEQPYRVEVLVPPERERP